MERRNKPYLYTDKYPEMDAEKYIVYWLNNKYGSGGKDIGDWTPNEVVEIMEDYFIYKYNKKTK